jgi:hypothetical protein
MGTASGKYRKNTIEAFLKDTLSNPLSEGDRHGGGRGVSGTINPETGHYHPRIIVTPYA